MLSVDPDTQRSRGYLLLQEFSANGYFSLPFHAIGDSSSRKAMIDWWQKVREIDFYNSENGQKQFIQSLPQTLVRADYSETLLNFSSDQKQQALSLLRMIEETPAFPKIREQLADKLQGLETTTRNPDGQVELVHIITMLWLTLTPAAGTCSTCQVPENKHSGCGQGCTDCINTSALKQEIRHLQRLMDLLQEMDFSYVNQEKSL
eukprot:c4407_g1_i3.p1 GENE.c4407_g1_i3~~c4407_g1_i3.p1  ORF type:complete len:205 (-),score=34.54 c4407_g1_i3:40-654(-)